MEDETSKQAPSLCAQLTAGFPLTRVVWGQPRVLSERHVVSRPESSVAGRGSCNSLLPESHCLGIEVKGVPAFKYWL